VPLSSVTGAPLNGAREESRAPQRSVQLFGDLLNVVPFQQGNARHRLIVAEHRYNADSSVTDVRIRSGVQDLRQGQLRLAQRGTLRLSVVDLLRVTERFGTFD